MSEDLRRRRASLDQRWAALAQERRALEAFIKVALAISAGAFFGALLCLLQGVLP